MDREHAAALIGAQAGSTPYGLDDRAVAVRDRIHPDMAEPLTIRRGVVCHRIEPSLLPVVRRRYRLRADGVVEVISNEHPEAAAIRRLRSALQRVV